MLKVTLTSSHPSQSDNLKARREKKNKLFGKFQDSKILRCFTLKNNAKFSNRKGGLKSIITFFEHLPKGYF